VISVILYGRNDAHGYNLHRRAALSLNCIAEVLADPDDEIVFVDYNTPDDLPTFVEALADTLTDRCLELIRVLRVPAAVHAERFAPRTHLPAIEPVARNAGVRRANPSNRWLLSTNTDMIFLPQSGRSLTEICAELADAFYGLPRFELPEWLWERLPRSDPVRAMTEVERLGPGLRLDEPTVSNEWIRFDAPGDFQLILREDFLAIDGLDEEMLLGYHVDSNLSRRMLLHRGSIESLGERLAGYHCNHNREHTVYHGSGKVANDLDRFVVKVDRAELPSQRGLWGLHDVELEEVPVRERSGPDFAVAVGASIPASPGARTPSDAARVPFELTYDSGHVLPFVADSLAVSPSDAKIGYLGANPVLEGMLATAVERLGFRTRLAVAGFDDLRSVDELARITDVFVVDLGVDASLVDASLSPSGYHEPAQLPARLEPALEALKRLIEIERARLELGEHPRRFVLVHSWTVFWDAYVLANLDCSHTTAHSRVRRGTVRRVPIDDEATRVVLARERRLIRWASRQAGKPRLNLRASQTVELAELTDYGGFADGWAYPDERGIWTEGSRSRVALELDGIGERDYVLALSLRSICVASDASLSVEASVDGERVAVRDFNYGDPEWYIELPAEAIADRRVELRFEVERPSSPLELGWSSDERRIGILLRAVALLPADDDAAQAGLAREHRLTRWAAREAASGERLHLRLGETVQLDDLSDYGAFGEGWVVYPQESGLWTEGSRSGLSLTLDGAGESDCILALSLGDICVAREGSLMVEALVNGERVAARALSSSDLRWRIELPAPVQTEMDLAFVIAEPTSRAEIGLSNDQRRLGIRLNAITLDRLGCLVRSREKIVFSEGSDAERVLGEGWSFLEPTGVWTDGDAASLVLKPIDLPPRRAELVLAASAFLTPDHPELKVEVSARGERLAGRVFRHGEAQRLLRIPWPIAEPSGQTFFELNFSNPARPMDLGMGDDPRRLGIFLEWLMVRKRRPYASLMDVVREKSANLRRRLGR
jgi:hypothetical protein